MQIDTIIFDLGGVLVWTDWDRFTNPISELSGLSPDEVMNQVTTGNAYYPFMNGEFDQSEFYRKMMIELGVDMPESEFVDTWSSIIHPHVEIAGIVEELSSKYRLVLGSNTDVLHHRRGIEVQPLLRHFDDMILSFEIGACKPDPAFFTRGVEKFSIVPERAVFIDDRADYVESAQSIGLTGIRFESVDQLRGDLKGLGLLRG